MNIKLTPEKKTAFLAALAETGNVSRAATAIGMSRVAVYDWREDDQEFAAHWEKAKRIGMGLLEDEAFRRAFEGVEKPVFYLGASCGAVREYSDTLTIFLLKAHDPKYREKTAMELTGANGAPIEFNDAQAANKLATLLALAQSRKAGEDSGEDLV